MPKIWLDAGHGGSDPGAVNGKRCEKDDALRFVLELDRQFRAQGWETVLPRKTDVTVSLAQRTALEKREKCDLAVSVHRNSGVSSAKGVEIWLHSKAPEGYVKWARDVLDGFAEVGVQTNRGVKKGYVGNPGADYAVNRDTSSPSMLVELGFVSNQEDNRLFDQNLQGYAGAVVRGCCGMVGVKYVERDDEETEAETDWKGLYLGIRNNLQATVDALNNILRKTKEHDVY